MKRVFVTAITALLFCNLYVQESQAAIALDRTRVIFNGSEPSMTVSIENKNKTLPYLAQSWLEDANGKKITSPLTALPPIQRVEPSATGQIKLQGLPAATSLLAQDKESQFYFNLREIPPKSNVPNTLQIALQTRIKLFYRPAALAVKSTDNPFQESITLKRTTNGFIVNNPTPYFVTIINAARDKGARTAPGFQPIMVPPKSQLSLGEKVSLPGNEPVLTYINDYGGRPRLIFHCENDTCHVARAEKG